MGYNAARTTILKISVICLGTPPIQLLSNIPAKIAPKPIHRIGNAPVMN